MCSYVLCTVYKLILHKQTWTNRGERTELHKSSYRIPIPFFSFFSRVHFNTGDDGLIEIRLDSWILNSQRVGYHTANYYTILRCAQRVDFALFRRFFMWWHFSNGTRTRVFRESFWTTLRTRSRNAKNQRRPTVGRFFAGRADRCRICTTITNERTYS